MKNIEVSYFSNAKMTKSTKITIANFIKLIKDCDFENTIHKIREENDQKKRNELKQDLSCITTSGLFEGGRTKANLVSHSGLIQVDFDKLVNFELAYNDLKKDLYTSILFISPSGTGLKVFVKIPSDTEKHLESFEGLESYYLKKYSLVMDKSTKDITRLCYVSADKKIFVNENAPIFTPQKETKNEPTEAKNEPKQTINKKTLDFINQDKYQEVERILDIIGNTDITTNYNDWLKIGFAFGYEFGENGRDLFHKVSQNHAKYTHQECDKQFTICLKNNTGQTKINTFFAIAKNNNIDISHPKKGGKHTYTIPKQSKSLNMPTAGHTAETPAKMTREEAERKLKNKYARIGTNYYLIEKRKTPQTWKKETILDDFVSYFSKTEIIDIIPKYTGFCINPENIAYKRNIEGEYNLYEPLAHIPTQGDTTKIHNFLHHIFTEKYEMALDYLTILYRYPKEKLPILCLVSEERSTGKSTFLQFLKEIFKDNCAILGNENFNGNFNSHYATKNIICVDESFIEKSNNEIVERLKRLNTDTRIYNTMKGIDSKEIDFFGKFILCSNRETDFIKIDKKENRFWVNLVPKYITEKPELLGEICQQIPAFLYEFHHRKITHDKKTRMWFDYSLIETQATQNLKEESKSNVEKIMCDYVNEMCDMINKTYFERTITDIRADLDHFFGKNKVNTQDITKFLKKEKKLMPTSSTRYTYYNFSKLIKKEIIDDTTGEVIEIAESERKTGKVYLLKQDDFPIL